MLRKVKTEDLAGKTIKEVDASSTNVLCLIFTDGTKAELWAELAVQTSAGAIAGIFIDVPVWESFD